MASKLQSILSGIAKDERELDRAIAKIALLKGINTQERRNVAMRNSQSTMHAQTVQAIQTASNTIGVK